MLSVLVLAGEGLNCEVESAAAYRMLGHTAQIVPMHEWLSGRVVLTDFDLLHIPGGFSFGDALGSGRVFANRLRYGRFANGRAVFDEIIAFVKGRGNIFGICNGFQALVKSGLLPNISGDYVQEVSLTTNQSARFENRWVRCTSGEAAQSWLTGTGAVAGSNAVYEFPARHGEGRLVARDEEVARGLAACTLLRYVDDAGVATEVYPANPNGSAAGIAGLVSACGRVFGMMPHPEANLSLLNHPDWAGRHRRASAATGTDVSPSGPVASDGLRFFRALTAHIEKQRTFHE